MRIDFPAEFRHTQTVEFTNFRLHYTLDDDRTHLVIVESNTSKLGAMEIRDIWGIGWKGPQELSAAAANQLLKDSADKKIGAWELHMEKDGTFFAIFNVKAPANSDGTALRSLTSAVATVADSIEELLLQSDEF